MTASEQFWFCVGQGLKEIEDLGPREKGAILRQVAEWADLTATSLEAGEA